MIVVSEFSRTSAEVGTDGTDHNQFNNSALIFGKNIKGGQVVGESQIYNTQENTLGSSLLHASPFDYKIMRPLTPTEIRSLGVNAIGKMRVDYIYPETIWRTVAKAMGQEKMSHIDSGEILSPLLLR